MVLHNINAASRRLGNGDICEIIEMRDKIGIGVMHTNYEELIQEATVLMTEYDKTAESSTKVMTNE